MKSEDLFEAVTELRDDQVLEGEKQLPRKRASIGLRLRTLAAALAVVVLAGALVGPRLLAGLRKPVGQGVDPGSTQAGATGAKPTGEAPSEDPNAPEERAFTLASPDYPLMAPYPFEKDFIKNQILDYEAYQTAMSAWRESRSALRPEADYTEGMDAYLRAALPELLTGEAGENGVCSPLNVYMALAMLAESTAGESRQELLSLLNAPDLETLRARANALWRANYCDDGRLTARLAASLWLRDDTAYKEETVETLSREHYASVFSGPMEDPEYTAALRRWMNKQTEGLLTDQIDGLEFSSDTAAALVTALYYQTAWAEPFCAPAEQVFHSPAGDREHSFMRRTEETALYEGKGFQAAGCDLAGGGSMYFLLPDEGLSPEELLRREEALDFLLSAEGRGNTDGRQVELTLTVPEFDVSGQIDLIGKLKDLGVTAVFDKARADFSPLTTDLKVPITLGKAEHGARLSVDENGVTGAAYTILMPTYGALPEEREKAELTLDRPFLFVVTNEEGLPLFVGIVNEP